MHPAGGVRGGQRVARLYLEVEVREGWRIVAVVVHDEREPEPQAGDVDGEGVYVHAVEVLLDDLELPVVGEAGAKFVSPEKALAQVEQLVQHTEQVRPAAARRIADREVLQGRQHGLGVVQSVRIVVIHEGVYGLHAILGEFRP